MMLTLQVHNNMLSCWSIRGVVLRPAAPNCGSISNAGYGVVDDDPQQQHADRGCGDDGMAISLVQHSIKPNYVQAVC